MSEEPFAKVRAFLEMLYTDRIREEWDAWIPVVGPEGAGKSTFILGCVWNWRAIRGLDPTVGEVLNSVVFDDREEFRRALVEYPEESAIPVMDAVHVLYNKEAMNPGQIETEKSLVDIRTMGFVGFLGYQKWGYINDQLRSDRAQYAFRIPSRGTVWGYNRESLDEVYASDGEEWPEPDLRDTFPSLEGTELWEEFKRQDKARKEERVLPEEDESGDERSLDEVVEEIKSRGVGQFVSENQTNGQRTIDKDLIRFEYDLSIRDARAVKKVLDRDVELPDSGGEPATP